MEFHGDFQRLLAVLGDDDRVPAAGEQFADHAQHGRIVVDQQNAQEKIIGARLHRSGDRHRMHHLPERHDVHLRQFQQRRPVRPLAPECIAELVDRVGIQPQPDRLAQHARRALRPFTARQA